MKKAAHVCMRRRTKETLSSQRQMQLVPPPSGAEGRGWGCDFWDDARFAPRCTARNWEEGRGDEGGDSPSLLRPSQGNYVEDGEGKEKEEMLFSAHTAHVCMCGGGICMHTTKGKKEERSQLRGWKKAKGKGWRLPPSLSRMGVSARRSFGDDCKRWLRLLTRGWREREKDRGSCQEKRPPT